jgi:hypothetical protein
MHHLRQLCPHAWGSIGARILCDRDAGQEGDTGSCSSSSPRSECRVDPSLLESTQGAMQSCERPGLSTSPHGCAKVCFSQSFTPSRTRLNVGLLL